MAENFDSKKISYIQIDHVNKFFDRGEEKLQILDDISFSVEKGQIACIVGASGCGKSTLLRAIAGLDPNHEGKILVDGQEALKGEPPGGQAADGQGVDGGAAAGDGQHLHAAFRAQPHQVLAGVGDGRGPGVGHQGAGLACQQPLQNGLTGGDVVVLVIADQGLFDLKVVQQLYGYPGILRRDKIHGLQRLHRPGGEVPQVADGGGDQI